MRNKFVKSILSSVVVLTLLVGCSGGKVEEGKEENKSSVRIGMVTDLGDIDDKSFNQLAWEGIQRANDTFGSTSKYLKPGGKTESEYLKEITNLYDAGIRFIVTPGFSFALPIYTAQSKYPDAKFVIVDSIVHSGDYVDATKENSAAILFKEHEAGFLAGVVAALELKEGEAGFIGGMETESVQKFNWGFQQGIHYANENLGTHMNMNPINFIYQGTFSEVAAGQQLSAQMYDRGVKVIFSAAGGVGSGVIKEARERASKGEEAWVIGVDADQYNDGIYEGNKSVILTSAMKRVDHAVFDIIALEEEGKFPGGEVLMYGIENDGVGLPQENPNLSEETIAKIKEIYELIKIGDISVTDKGTGLLK